MLLTFYRLLWWVCLPLILVYRFCRDRSSQQSGRFCERLGFSHKLQCHDLVIHAVSLGEVRAVTPLVEALLVQYPKLTILFTATTLTGSEQIVRSFSGRVTHLFLPLDHELFVRRFLRKNNPKAVLIMETELWPNLINEARKLRVPIYIISACLSQKSYYGYQKFPKSIQRLVKALYVLAQTEGDAGRFKAIGVENVCVMGNLKYAVSVGANHEKNSHALAAAKGTKLLWLLASSHEQEEALVISAYKALKTHIPNLILAIAPRHPERFTTVEALLNHAGLTYLKRSRTLYESFHAKVDVWLFDSIGELLFLYAAADIVTVGGSFVPIGGHNILEPAFLGKPITVGPYTENIGDTYKAFLSNKAIIQMDASTIEETIEKLCHDAQLRLTLGNNARDYVALNQEALPKLLAAIKPYLGE